MSGEASSAFGLIWLGLLFLCIVAPFLFASAEVLDIRSTWIRKAMIVYSIIVTAAFWFADHWVTIGIVAGIGFLFLAKLLRRYMNHKNTGSLP